MDVVEASHLQVIKDHLEANPNSLFKAQSLKKEDNRLWNLWLIDANGVIVSDIFSPSFGEAAKAMSAWISMQPS